MLKLLSLVIIVLLLWGTNSWENTENFNDLGKHDNGNLANGNLQTMTKPNLSRSYTMKSLNQSRILQVM